MDAINIRVQEIERLLREFRLVCKERMARLWQQDLKIPRVYSHIGDDTDLDDAPEAYVGARLRPRHPLGGSAIALPEPDEDPMVCAISTSGTPASPRR